jgi:sulfoxide reductase catalytic subunit YedY
MRIHTRLGWERPEHSVTPEAARLGRRLVLGAAAGSVAGLLLPGSGLAAAAAKYPPGRPVTPAADVENYNNFYEFGTDKDIADAAQALPVSPWSVELAGLVEKPRTLALEDLLRQVTLEERIYRHRCVEAWAMTVPWTGFPLSKLVALAAPLASAKYVRFESLADRKTMPGLRRSYFPWPYVEAVTMQEAANDLAFLATGLYGRDLPKQDGAPIRLVLPWKYGFKSAKSLVRISFVEKRPATFWEAIDSDEYGFWANVNPAVPHPRWSQATERLLGTDDRVPTQIYNGYGAFVADMYADKQSEKLFM